MVIGVHLSTGTYSGSKKPLSKPGAVAGVVIGSVVGGVAAVLIVVGVIALVTFFAVRRYRRRAQPYQRTEGEADEDEQM